MSGQPAILLDTCVLINLLTTQEIEQILRATEADVLVCAAVLKESIFLRPDDPKAPPQPVELDPFLRSGVLKLSDIQTEHEGCLFVDYAAELDDGEAMSLALVESRGYVLATHYHKARRLFLEAVGMPERLLSTSDLVRAWAEHHAVSLARGSHALTRITVRARFFPAPDDLNYPWWCKVCQ